MSTYPISCIYYPTTTLLIDDHDNFLEHLQRKLGPDFPCLIYTDPPKALQHLKEEVKRNDTLRGIMGVNSQSEHCTHQSVTLPIQYDIQKFQEHIYNANRFSEISVIIVDYAMPDLSGEELCQALKGSPLKVIMLTGETDKGTAIQLFNAGLIHKFILKRQANVDEILRRCIFEMQQRYFQDLTHPIIQGLSANEDSALDDPLFFAFVNQVYLEISACSYYLIDLSGSFIFLDKQGSPTWLIIKTNQELEDIATIMIEADASSPWLDSLKKREKIPYFYDFFDNFDFDYPAYPDYWYPAQRLEGKREYYYAIVKNLKSSPFNPDKVFSFNDYLHHHYLNEKREKSYALSN